MAYFGYDSLKIIIYSFSKVPFQDYPSIVFSFQSGFALKLNLHTIGIVLYLFWPSICLFHFFLKAFSQLLYTVVMGRYHHLSVDHPHAFRGKK